MIKKILLLAGLALLPMSAIARVTGTSPTGTSADIWCAGPSGAEVCVDSSGNLIPTTDDDADLGTPALQFRHLNIDGDASIDSVTAASMTVSGAASFNGNVTLGDAVGDTLTVNAESTFASVVNISTHVATSGAKPVATSCGTSPSVVGNDTAGIITIGSTASDACTLTFDKSYEVAPACILIDSDSAVSLGATTTAIAITITALAATDFSGDFVMYFCIEQDGA